MTFDRPTVHRRSSRIIQLCKGLKVVALDGPNHQLEPELMNTTPLSKLLASAFVAAAALATQSALAIPTGYTLTLTEQSSTVLTYTYTNPTDPMAFTVTNVTSNIWNISPNPGSGIVLHSGELIFAEGPGEPGKANYVPIFGAEFGGPNAFTVNSDFDLVMGDPIVTSGFLGTDDGVTITLLFVEAAEASETAVPGVPDSGSTLGLAAVSLTALLGMGRWRRVSRQLN